MEYVGKVEVFAKMVRLGDGASASALDRLDEVLIKVRDPEAEDDEEAEERPKAIPKKTTDQKPVNRKLVDHSRPEVNVVEQLVEEIEKMEWRDYMKAARRARDERIIREKYAKYGPFKDIVLHPTSQAVLAKVEKAWTADIVWVSPIMPATQAVMIFFMAWRGGISGGPFCALVCFILGVHPHLVFLAIVLMLLLRSRRRPLPKGCKSVPRWPAHFARVAKVAKSSTTTTSRALEAHTQDLVACTSVPTFESGAAAAAHMENAGGADYLVLGGDLGARFAAAMLARCGKRVLLIEPALGDPCSTSEGGVVHFGGLDFVVGDATLPGGAEGATYAGMLAALAPPLPPATSATSAAQGTLGAIRALVGGKPSATGAAAAATKSSSEDASATASAGRATALPWETSWVRVGGASGVHLVTSLDGGEPLLWGAGFGSWIANAKRCGAHDGAAALFMQRLLEAKGLTRWAAKLATRVAPSSVDRALQAIQAPSAGVAGATAAADAFDNLLAWRTEDALTAPGVIGELLAPTRARHPELYQLALVHALARENVAAPALSFGHMALAATSGLDGRCFPRGGPAVPAAAMLPALALSGGGLLRAKIDAVVVSGRGSSSGGGAGGGSGSGGNTVTTTVARTTGVRLVDGTLLTAREGVISALGVHRTASLVTSGVSPLLESLSKLPRARSLVHTLVALKGSAASLELVAADYANLPPLLDDSGNTVAPAQGGAGCAPSANKWMMVSFPSAKDPDWPHSDRSTCVITTEAEDDWEGKAFEKHLQAREAMLIKRLVERFPLLEDNIEFVKTMKPVFRGLSIHADAYPPAAAAAVAAGTGAGGDATTAAPTTSRPLPPVRVVPCTDVAGLFLASRDVVALGGLSGQLMGSWLAAHAALGYDATDIRLYGRNIVEEVREHSRG